MTILREIFKAPDIVIPNSKNRKTLRTERYPTEEQALDICNGIGLAMRMMYPNYHWEIGMNQNIVFIKNSTLNNRMAYHIHINKIDPEGKTLMRIGGEILERYNVRRGRGTYDEVELLERDILDNCTPET